MSIPEACIEAAHICQPTAEVRAKGVILALADHLPESAVDAGCDAVNEIVGLGGDTDRDVVRVAIIAALKDIVEGE